MSDYYPLMLNITGEKCIVIGGGDVAERKAKTFLECGAKVHVISPDISPALQRLEKTGQIGVTHRSYQPGDLSDALVVVAATDDQETNENIFKEGQRSRILTNVVDDPENSNFIVPSLLRRGDLLISISTSGRSPALARKIRTELEQHYGNEYESLTIMLSEIRAELKDQGIQINSEEWQKALNLDAMLDLIQKDRYDEAKNKLLSELKRVAI